MHFIDWLVIGLYALGMLGVGWYYARRTKSSEDYLLGGRNMSPLMVGLSLFATLMSTLSYLSFPGEMIQYGPIMYAGLASFPLVFLIVGWWLIPTFMRLRVTSGYEILEMRFGLSARLVGAFLFLLLRLMWMATIIYATVDKAIVPILGIDRQANPLLIPLISGIIGIITLIYTSMGGLRAVVVTDSIQTLILLGGAILTVLLITIHFGGVGGWWPHEWPTHWPPPKYAPDLTTKRTFANAFLALFAWYICTAGSDQMAIQRYLSTRDVAAARRSFGVSMLANTIVLSLLGLVGMAVLAYFTDQPEMLAQGQTVQENADNLFARYIRIGLPVGLTGLVTAGLMAAAMSSLSSGMNSSSSVISEDFVERLGKVKHDEAAHVRRARWISVIVGAAAVLLSFGVGYIPGNLLEVVYRMSNTLVAPLFILFFMALFVRRATTFGTLVGVAASAAYACAISFLENWLHVGVFWNIPIPAVFGAGVAILASYAPIGRPAPPLPKAGFDKLGPN